MKTIVFMADAGMEQSGSGGVDTRPARTGGEMSGFRRTAYAGRHGYRPQRAGGRRSGSLPTGAMNETFHVWTNLNFFVSMSWLDYTFLQ